MIHGKKNTSEKTLLCSMKLLQKLTNKNSKTLFQLGVINTTPTFKVNEQVIKRGKRKTIKATPLFITKNSMRITTSLKSIRNIAIKQSKDSEKFYKTFIKEILAASSSKSVAVDKKTELQRQVSANRRFISRFRW